MLSKPGLLTIKLALGTRCKVCRLIPATALILGLGRGVSIPVIYNYGSEVTTNTLHKMLTASTGAYATTASVVKVVWVVIQVLGVVEVVVVVRHGERG